MAPPFGHSARSDGSAGQDVSSGVTRRQVGGAEWGGLSWSVALCGSDLLFEGLSAMQVSLLEENPRLGGRGLALDPVTHRVRTLVRRGQAGVGDHERFVVAGIYTPTVVCERDYVRVAGVGFEARLAMVPGLPHVLTTGGERLTAEAAVIQNYLRILSSYLALLAGGLLLHCAAVVVDGAVHLFLGRSGAGKTTLARKALAEGFEVLSDDTAVLQYKGARGFFVSYVPFEGELGVTCTAPEKQYPLGGLAWLVQAPEAKRVSLPLAVQLARCMACCPVVNADPHRATALLKGVEGLLAWLPLEELHLPKAGRFVDSLRRD